MRILFVIHDFIPEVRAGSELYTFHLSLELQRRGHEVLVFYPTWGLKTSVQKTVDGVHCYTFPNVSNPLGIFADFNPSVDEIFAQVLNEFRPEIVHFQHLLYLSLHLVEIAKRFGARIVYTLHDYWLLCPRITLLAYDAGICHLINHIKCVECCKRIVGLETQPNFRIRNDHHSRWLKRIVSNTKAYTYLKNQRAGYVREQIYDNTDLFISPSRFLRQTFLRDGLPEKKIIYLDNGTSGTIYKNIVHEMCPEIRFGYIGTIAPHKGINILLEAFNRIPDATLKIYGRLTPEHSSMSTFASNPNIRFMGEVDEHEKRSVFENLDVLVIPSIWYENSPVTIHEACLAGIPVIASNLGGMAEYIHHLENGLLFTPGSSTNLYEQIRYLIDNPGELSRLSGNTAEIMSIERHTNLLVDIYRNLLNSRSTHTIDHEDLHSLYPGVSQGNKQNTPLSDVGLFIKSTVKTFRDALRGLREQERNGRLHYRVLSLKEIAGGKPVNVEFGGTIELTAFDYRLEIDDSVTIWYRWKIIRKHAGAQMVFVHFCLGDRIIFQQDHFIFNNELPTGQWRCGRDIEELYRFDVSNYRSISDTFSIRIGIVDPQCGTRLKISSRNNHEVDDFNTRVSVGELRLLPTSPAAALRQFDVSIVIPTLNAGPEFALTLERILRQQTSRRFEVLAIDSGSSDETIPLCMKYGVRLIQIDRKQFNHGLTRNLGIYQAKSAFAVMLVQDAIPSDEQWLENLLKHFGDEEVAGVFCRQIPRDDADVLTKRSLNRWLTARPDQEIKRITDRHQYEQLSGMEKYYFCLFDDVCSCIRKSVWERHPYPETDFAEDLYFSKSVLEAGYKIVYEPDAAVIHSHDRSLINEYKRTYIGHRKLYDLFQVHTVPRLKDVFRNFFPGVIEDLSYLLKHESDPHRRLLMALKIPGLTLLSGYAQYRGANDQIAYRKFNRIKDT